MLEQIKSLVETHQWDQLHHLAATLPAGDPLARVHLALSKHEENEAADGTGYRRALAHARAALAAATPGGLLHTWALHRIAAQLADLGDYRGAEKAAEAFLQALPNHPQAQTVAPWVYAALGRVHQYRRQPLQAVTWFQRALDADAEGEVRERIQLLQVWAWAEAGRTGSALKALPSSLMHLPLSHLHAAQSRVCLAAGDLKSARKWALLALRHCSAGEWRSFDTIQAAEMALILRTVAIKTGDGRQAATRLMESAAILSRWNLAVIVRLVLMLRTGGGELPYAAAPHRGPAGYHRCSLTGTVG